MGFTLFRPIVFVALELMSFAGLITNLLCIAHVVKCFNVRKTVFLLLLLDAAISCLGCFLSSVCLFFLEKGFAPCSLVIISSYSPYVLGCFITAEISVIRLYSVKLSLQNAKLNEHRIRLVAVLLLASFGLYIFLIFLVCALLNLPFSIMVETCIDGDMATLPHPYVILGFYLPCVFLPVISLTADAGIIRILKNLAPVVSISNSKSSAMTFDTIPVRATVLSALTLVPPLVFTVLLKVSGLSKLDTTTGTLITVIMFRVWRCPAETLLSFAYKSKQESQVREKTRAERLRKVIKEAEEERAVRKMIRVSELQM